MAQNVVLNKGNVAIEPFFDATQEMLSGGASNFKLRVTSNTQITAEAGTDSGNDQASIAIQGKYRYRTTNVVATHPGGAAGTHNVFVTGSGNDFTGPPSAIDLTSYDFGLQILTAGTPSGGGIVHYRKVGEVDWDGTKITHLRQLIGHGSSTLPINPTAGSAQSTPVKITGAASQTGDLLQIVNSSGTFLSGVRSDGDHVLADGRSIRGLDGQAVTNPGGAVALRGGAGNTTGAGGAASLIGGAGGNAGNGGAVNITSGAAAGATSVGGSVNITTGAAGGFGSTAGSISVTATGAAGATSGGNVTITSAPGTQSGGSGGIAGTVTIRGGDSIGSPAGGAITIRGGDTSGASGGNGGAVTLQGGNAGAGGAGSTGGTATLRGGNSTGQAGGAVVLLGGDAGSSGNQPGGAVSIQGGTGRVSSNLGAGGAVTITGGQAGGNTTGGLVTIQGGEAGNTSGSGGSVIVVGAANGGGANPGSVTIKGGAEPAASIGGNATITGGMGRPGGTVNITGGPADNVSGAVGGQVVIAGGLPPSGNPGNGGAVTMRGGDAGSGVGGDATVRGGNGAAGTNAGGSLTLAGGNSGGGAGGAVTVKAGTGGSSTVDLQSSAGASKWKVGSTNTPLLGNGAADTSGQALRIGTSTSDGNAANLTNGGTWTTGTSLRETKAGFETYKDDDLLKRLMALPVEEYHYKPTTKTEFKKLRGLSGKDLDKAHDQHVEEIEDERHFGPMADDFAKQFPGLAIENGKTFAPSDLAGLALGGVQALVRRVEELEKQLAERS